MLHCSFDTRAAGISSLRRCLAGRRLTSLRRRRRHDLEATRLTTPLPERLHSTRSTECHLPYSAKLAPQNRLLTIDINSRINRMSTSSRDTLINLINEPIDLIFTEIKLSLRGRLTSKERFFENEGSTKWRSGRCGCAAMTEDFVTEIISNFALAYASCFESRRPFILDCSMTLR